jgi:hypothetical protein
MVPRAVYLRQNLLDRARYDGWMDALSAFGADSQAKGIRNVKRVSTDDDETVNEPP